MPKDAIDVALAREEVADAGIERRTYQIAAARKICAMALEGHDVELQLPTGTGKTLVANMVALLCDNIIQARGFWLVAPRRTLAAQHNRYAAWARVDLTALLLNDGARANAVRLAGKVQNSGLIIGLPGITANAIETGAILPDIVRSTDLMIVDEFDEFLHQDIDRDKIFVRFDVDFQRLRDALPKGIRTVLVSGTSPSGGAAPESARLAAFVRETLNPAVVAPPKRSYAKFVPKVRLIVRYVYDGPVQLLDEAIGTDLMFALNNLGAAMMRYVDTDWLFPRLPLILAGKIP